MIKKQCSGFPSHCTSFDHYNKECPTCDYHFYKKNKLECASIGIENCLTGKPDTCTLSNRRITYLDEPTHYKKLPDNCAHSIMITSNVKLVIIIFIKLDKLECASIGIENCLTSKSDTCALSNKTITYLDDPKHYKKLHINCAFSDDDNKECKSCNTYFYKKDKLECANIGISHCKEGKPEQYIKCDEGFDLTDNRYVERYIETEPICYNCDDNYKSFDYGATCTVLDNGKESKSQPQPEGNTIFTNLNLAFIILILSFIL